MIYEHSFKIGNRTIGARQPAYFIADIGANHDGQLGRAKDLIKLAKDFGVDCAKFQHFQASKIVSAVGFDGMNSAHQRAWDKSVFEVYADASINPDWNAELADTCKQVGIDFMTSPYDIVSAYDNWKLMPAFKIGSGEISNLPFIEEVAKFQNIIFLATGASTMPEVEAAVQAVLRHTPRLCLMQCNTNYTGSFDNFAYVNLKVISHYLSRFPHMPVGLSDHTPGHVCVLGAVALGASVIEKHFTDDATRKGPDHAFALEPDDWHRMVSDTRWLEQALGDGMKDIEVNEFESRIVQRRALRLKDSREAGAMIVADALEALRPCPDKAYTPAQIGKVVGRRLRGSKEAGQELYPEDLE